MSKVGPFFVSYDPRADVLYLNLRREEAARGFEDERGIVWRYAGDGSLIGVTLLDFRDLWMAHREALADEFSREFHVAFKQASDAIELAAREAV